MLRADIPAVGTVSARGIARMYAALMGEVDGVRLISPERLRQITKPVTHGPDWAFGGDLPKTLGYAAEVGGARLGWGGMGGSLAGFCPRTTWPWPARRTTWARTTATRWRGWPSSSASPC